MTLGAEHTRATLRQLFEALSGRHWDDVWKSCAESLELWLPEGAGWRRGLAAAEDARRDLAARAPHASFEVQALVVASDGAHAVAELALTVRPGATPQPVTLVLELADGRLTSCRSYVDPRALSTQMEAESA
jgi:ketosteroid isomerase-like protein